MGWRKNNSTDEEAYLEVNMKYRNQVRPIFEMLLHKKTHLKFEEWMSLVKRTEQSILISPDQYLFQPPSKKLSDAIIHHLFDEFLHESV